MKDYELIDPESWVRKEHYYFFKSFEEPFTGVVTKVNVGKARAYCKSRHISFFQYYLHKSICAVNATEAFRLRIVNGEIRKYKEIHASATISRSNGTFGFSHIVFDREFDVFSNNVEEEKQRIEKDTSLFPPTQSDSVIHYSSMPWISFTSVSHARKMSIEDASPKISFGKVLKENKEWLMPVSIHVHHALVDGRDIGAHLEIFQELLDEH